MKIEIERQSQERSYPLLGEDDDGNTCIKWSAEAAWVELATGKHSYQHAMTFPLGTKVVLTQE